METIKIKASLIRVLLILFALIILPRHLISQSCYSSFIDSIISQVSIQNISNYNLELTGEVPTVVGGQPCTIISRYWESPFNQKAAQYIYEKFQSFGLETRYQVYSSTGVNVLAKKTGTKYPNQQIIICAHYDNIVNGIVSDTTYGADDNASGTCCVLEAARILCNLDMDYTVVFAAWDEEELWLVGSSNYADSAFLHQDSIVCVINLDMIAYDGNNDGIYRILTDTASVYYAGVFSSCGYIYQPQLECRFIVGAGASDHLPFQEKGYNAICGIENNPDFNPFYHTINERFDKLNLPYFERLVKTAIASLLMVSKDYIINIEHDPLQSSYDTTSRIVTAVITSKHPIDRNVISKRKGSPKLYWKTGNGSFLMTNAVYSNLDTFKFVIPGQPAGTTVSYYIAAQDSLATMVGSLPGGANGMSPPGTVPPPNVFVYQILRQMNVCSNTAPKSIPPLGFAYDTIRITQNGVIQDCNLNLTIYHTNDSSLYIMLVRPGLQQIQLSAANGGSGDNYFNTTFDDEAELSITEGIPPFIGSYRPEVPLSKFDNKPISGEWILKIFNYSPVVTGQLANWCLDFSYYDPIGITNNQIPVKNSLSQNYPNPFNSSTKISYSLVRKSHVKITIYDILGKEVSVPVNGVFNNGKYYLDFNANNLASGLYFYTMYLDGNLLETKKMILVK